MWPRHGGIRRLLIVVGSLLGLAAGMLFLWSRSALVHSSATTITVDGAFDSGHLGRIGMLEADYSGFSVFLPPFAPASNLSPLRLPLKEFARLHGYSVRWISLTELTRLDREQQEALRRQGDYYEISDYGGSTHRIVPKSYFKKSLEDSKIVDWKEATPDETIVKKKEAELIMSICDRFQVDTVLTVSVDTSESPGDLAFDIPPSSGYSISAKLYDQDGKLLWSGKAIATAECIHRFAANLLGFKPAVPSKEAIDQLLGFLGNAGPNHR